MIVTLFDSYEGDTRVQEAHERRIQSCTSCQAKIIFFKTDKGNWMPVDADTVEPDDQVLDLSRHQSHFASCTKPDEHRKSKGKKK